MQPTEQLMKKKIKQHNKSDVLMVFDIKNSEMMIRTLLYLYLQQSLFSVLIYSINEMHNNTCTNTNRFWPAMGR